MKLNITTISKTTFFEHQDNENNIKIWSEKCHHSECHYAKRCGAEFVPQSSLIFYEKMLEPKQVELIICIQVKSSQILVNPEKSFPTL
jgi:hypothetical protein